MYSLRQAESCMEPSMKKVSFSRSPLNRSSSSSQSCLGFFSSKTPHRHHRHHHHRRRRHRTPKSAPNPTRVRLLPKQLKPPPLLKPNKEKKKKIYICSSRMANMGPDGESLQKIKMDYHDHDHDHDHDHEDSNSNNFTPPGKDVATPPIQASISPEIQIGGFSSTSSSIISTTPAAACFAAGHLLSGVTDKRKCRPRGILAVPAAAAAPPHQVHNLGLFCTPSATEPSNTDDPDDSRLFFVPEPAQASMHWLLSPPPSPTTTTTTTTTFPCKPINPHQQQNARESFSCSSNLSSYNLISTPQSHSSSENPMSNPLDVLPLPGFTFHFSDSTTPLSNDGSHYGSHPTASTEMRISWIEEGLASRVFEMDDDEFDYCQWLSEDEKDQSKCNFDSDPMLPKSATEKPAAAIELHEKKVVSPPATPINPCAESISTQGGGSLVASTDSDWTLSYKNHLFKS